MISGGLGSTVADWFAETKINEDAVMQVLPDISIHAESFTRAESFSDEKLIDLTQRVLTAGAAHFILAGRYFRILKARNPGRFMKIVKLEFEDYSIDTIENWMTIEEAFPDPTTWANLPSAWTTQLILARIPQELRHQWMEDGTIHRRLTGKLAQDLLCEALPAPVPINDPDHDGDGDHGGGGDHGENHDDGEQEGDHAKVNAEINRGGVGADSNAELEHLKAHVKELEAYIEQLKAEKTCDEREIATLKGRVTELTAAAGLSDIPIKHQRCQFSHALETAEEADRSKNKLERERLQKDAGHYVLEIVQSSRRDGLDTGLIDLVYRAEPKELTKDKETSFVPTGTEAHSQEQVSI